jgi:two-component system, LytTR family, sensor kinase
MGHVMSGGGSPTNDPPPDERPGSADEWPAAANGDLIAARLGEPDPASSDHGLLGHKPRSFKRIAIAVILVFWMTQFTTLTLARLVRLDYQDMGNAEPRAVVTTFAILISFGILAVLRASRGTTLLRRALIAAGLGAAGATIHTAVNMTVFTLYGAGGDSSLSELVASYGVSLFDFVWFYCSLTVMLLALTYGEDLVENRDRIASLQAQANVAQLKALRYQLNPHFLFNTLNSVASLISKNQSANAETMVVSLSDFLRSTLQMDAGTQIPLGDEIALQSLYLDIEKVRFPHRLNVAIDVPEDACGALVPNLITQPLIENAIKYGVARSSEPVHLEVIARIEGARLLIEIKDDGGNAGDGAPKGTRVGLRNVADRLRLHYGEEASLTTRKIPEGGFSARIHLPLRRAR